MILRPALLAAAFLCSAGPALAQSVDECRAVIQRGEDLVTLDTPVFSIIEQRGVLQRLDVAESLAMISCVRSSIVPAPGDYRVMRDLGVPLTLIHGDRVGALELVEGRINFRMVVGSVQPGDVGPIQQSLNDAQTVLNASGQ